MKTILCLLLLSLTMTVHAAKIDDVKVLDMKYLKGSFEVKLQVHNGKKDSYFVVDIVKEDEKAFEKLALVLKKLKGKGLKLTLEIPSFSAHPSGAYYKSTSVTFVGSAEGDSLL